MKGELSDSTKDYIQRNVPGEMAQQIFSLESILTQRDAELEECRNELAGRDSLMDKLRPILNGVANALNGEPPDARQWLWHDLDTKAANMVAELVELREKYDLLKQAVENS